MVCKTGNSFRRFNTPRCPAKVTSQELLYHAQRYGLTSAVLAESATTDAQLRVGAVSDGLGLIADYTQATNANKPLWSRADNRENLNLWSDDFSNAARLKTGRTILGAAVANPVNGALTAWGATEDGASSQHGFIVTGTFVTSVAGINYQHDIYIKGTGTRRIGVNAGAGFGNAWVYVSPDGTPQGTFNSPTDVIIDVLADGWLRIRFKKVASTSGSAALNVYGVDNSNGTTYTGDSTTILYCFRARSRVVGTDDLETPTTDHPQYAGVNGRRWLVFNGDQVMSTTSTMGDLVSASGKLVYVVAQSFLVNYATERQRIFGDSGGNIAVQIPTSTDDWQGTNFAAIQQTVSLADSVTRLPQIIRYRHQGGNIYVAVDNGVGFTESAATVSGNTTTGLALAVSIGSNPTRTIPFFGKIGGIFTRNVGVPDSNFEYYLKSWAGL